MSAQKRSVGVHYEGYGNGVTLADLRLLMERAGVLEFSDEAQLRVTVKESDNRVTSARLVDDEPEATS